jgi:hypothetical protein
VRLDQELANFHAGAVVKCCRLTENQTRITVLKTKPFTTGIPPAFSNACVGAGVALVVFGIHVSLKRDQKLANLGNCKVVTMMSTPEKQRSTSTAKRAVITTLKTRMESAFKLFSKECAMGIIGGRRTRRLWHSRQLATRSAACKFQHGHFQKKNAVQSFH